jgi:hypothetical protein
MKKLFSSIFLGFLLVHNALAGDILKASPWTGTPFAVQLSWACPSGVSAASAGGNDKNWQGTKSTTGKQNLSGITVPSSYTIACTSPDTVATTVTIIPSAPNADGTTLPTAGYHLYWSPTPVLEGASWPNVIDVPGPSGGDVPVPNLPVGTVYLACDAYIAGGSKSNMSSVITKQITKGMSATDKIDIVMPGAPRAVIKQ